jgi:hypothetical protein
MAAIPITQVLFTPVLHEDVATPASETGDTFVNTPNRWLFVLNSSGVTVTVTIPKQDDPKVAGLGVVTLEDLTFSVPAGELGVMQIPPLGYQTGDGEVEVEYSTHADVTVAVIEFQR